MKENFDVQGYLDEFVEAPAPVKYILSAFASIDGVLVGGVHYPCLFDLELRPPAARKVCPRTLRATE